MTTYTNPKDALAQLKVLLAEFPQRKYLSFDELEDRKFISEVLLALRFAAPILLSHPDPVGALGPSGPQGFPGVSMMDATLKREGDTMTIKVPVPEDAFAGEQPVKIENDGSVTPIGKLDELKQRFDSSHPLPEIKPPLPRKLHWKTRQKLERQKAMETNLSPND